MSEENSAPEQPEIIAAPVDSAGLGATLRAGRERLGMDVDEAARQLCLSPRQLVALESDDYDILPSPTFARGFIRNYARLLQLPAEPLLAQFRQKVPEVGNTAAISLHSEGIPILNGNNRGWMPYLVASLVILLAAAGWWFYMDWRERQPAPVQAPVVAEESAAETPPMGIGLTAAELVQPPTLEAVVPGAGQPQAEGQPQANAQPQPVASAQPAAPNAQPVAEAAVAGASGLPRLVIRFNEESWVRVVDAAGKELLNATRPAGSQAALEGVAPFKLDVGNAAGVELRYNDRPVDLAPGTRANVAHLVLE